jgi:hypothetical protein
VGRGLALEIESFLVPLELDRADRGVPFGAQVMDAACGKCITLGAV